MVGPRTQNTRLFSWPNISIDMPLICPKRFFFQEITKSKIPQQPLYDSRDMRTGLLADESEDMDQSEPPYGLIRAFAVAYKFIRYCRIY